MLAPFKWSLLFTLFIGQTCKADTAFVRLFSSNSATSVTLNLTPQEWDDIAAEKPVGGACNFSLDPNIDRYKWHKADASVTVDGPVKAVQSYPQIGVKKKSFCGSLDNAKPSLKINFAKYVEANEPLAKAQLGTTRLSLENSKQDPDLFRQCVGYYVFRISGIPAPMCAFISLYRQAAGTPETFLGLYLVTEETDKEFFHRREDISRVAKGSLYEFEYGDDFTPATISQLQVEWSATDKRDFLFAVDQVKSNPDTALPKILDLPAFIRFWATEIFLKNQDGLVNNTNNTLVYDDPPADTEDTVQKTRFQFLPHGIDRILGTDTKPAITLKAVIGKLAYNNNRLRYQLIKTLASMGEQIEHANLPSYIHSLLPSVVANWRGDDVFFGADRNRAIEMANRVALAVAQAINEIQATYGRGVLDAPVKKRVQIKGLHHLQCATGAAAKDTELARASCTHNGDQKWTFVLTKTSMKSIGFKQANTYRIRGNKGCLTAGAQFADGGDHYKIILAPCKRDAEQQRFFLVRREGGAFELHAFARHSCVHFSDSASTADGRPAIYLGPCDGSSKNLVVAE